MAAVNTVVSHGKTKKIEPRFSSVAMEMGNNERKVASAGSFDSTRTRFLNNPGVPVSTEDDRIRLQMESLRKDKSKRKKSRRQQGTTESLDPNDTEDPETKRVRELQERHMRILDDLTKIRDHYVSVYVNELTDKVENQRRDIQKRTDRLNRQILMKELKEKRESHRVKKRHERSQLNHDNTFLENLPRTKLHQIVCLEEKMMREGKLRTLEDLERFWSDIGKPETFRLMLEGGVGEATMTGSQEDIFSQPSHSHSLDSSLTSLHQADRPMDAFTRGLSQIYEDNEPSRPGTKTGGSQSWAITQQHKKDKSRRESRKTAAPSVLQEQEPDPILQLAKVEFPQLSCYTLDLEPAKEDPEKLWMKEDQRQKARVRDYEKRRFRRMYETSLTHQAATQRIFSRNNEFMDVLHGPSLADVVNTGRMESDSDCNSDILVDDDLGLTKRLLSLTMAGEDPRFSQRHETTRDEDEAQDQEEETGSEEGSSRRSSAGSRGSHQSRTREALSLQPPFGKYTRPEKPSPLTLDSILPKCKVKEAKGLSSLWINYGKFLPSLQ